MSAAPFLLDFPLLGGGLGVSGKWMFYDFTSVKGQPDCNLSLLSADSADCLPPLSGCNITRGDVITACPTGQQFSEWKSRALSEPLTHFNPFSPSLRISVGYQALVNHINRCVITAFSFQTADNLTHNLMFALQSGPTSSCTSVPPTWPTRTHRSTRTRSCMHSRFL